MVTVNEFPQVISSELEFAFLESFMTCTWAAEVCNSSENELLLILK